MRRDASDSRLGQESQARVQTVYERRRLCSSLPGERAIAPGLLEITVVFRCLHAVPAHQQGLYALARAIREVQPTEALRHEQPFMACPRRDIYQLILDIKGERAH